MAHHGILIVRLRQPNRRKIHQAVNHDTGQIQEWEWHGLLVIVRDTTMSKLRSGGEIERGAR